MSENFLGIEARDVEVIYTKVAPRLSKLVNDGFLDQQIFNRLGSTYIPLAIWINRQQYQHPVVIGINGAMGAGKSTLVRLLKILLEEAMGKRVLTLSIDDLYYSKEYRLAMAKDIHPLLVTRGVPGTHDVQAGIRILKQCRSGVPGEIRIPVFDKFIDDLMPESEWPAMQLPVDIVLFEGWFVGAIPQAEHELAEPINQLESDEDVDAIWRHYVNDQLRGCYQDLFGLIDKLIMMKIPSMEQVMEWRHQQEKVLASQAGKRDCQSALMSEEEVARFILHDERLIRYQLKEMPLRADLLLEVGTDHQICEIRIRNPA